MFNYKNYTKLDILFLVIKCTPIIIIIKACYMILWGLIPAYQTISIGYFIDTVNNIFNGKVTYSDIYVPILMILLFVIFTHLAPTIMGVIDEKWQNKLQIKLKTSLTLKINKLEYKHIENTKTIELINRVYNNFNTNFIGGFNNMVNICTIAITVISIVIIIMKINIIVAIVIIIITIPLIHLAIKTGKQSYAMNIDAENIKREYMYLGSLLKGKKYANERNLFLYSDKINQKYGELCDKSYDIERKVQIKTFINLKGGSIITLIISLIIIGLLLASLYKNEITIGIFIALTNAIFTLVQTMSYELSNLMLQNSLTNEYLKEFSSFINLSEKLDAYDKKCNMQGFVFNSLEFVDVSFRYDESASYVLKNCSFKLIQGKTYAFVGENGAGKSTIIKLITGLYDDYDGEILINGKCIKKYSFSELRGIISVVYQDFAKYFLTIKDNITLGNIGCENTKHLENIISKMAIDDIACKLPNGINTYVGKIRKDSSDLSGGQWQKIAISRLLYANTWINILDEPTASLDPIEESRTYEMFKRVSTDRFVIYITHRLGAVKSLDEILVLQSGKIVEAGHHNELMEIENGVYKKMFEAQKSWYE